MPIKNLLYNYIPRIKTIFSLKEIWPGIGEITYRMPELEILTTFEQPWKLSESTRVHFEMEPQWLSSRGWFGLIFVTSSILDNPMLRPNISLCFMLSEPGFLIWNDPVAFTLISYYYSIKKKNSTILLKKILPCLWGRIGPLGLYII